MNRQSKLLCVLALLTAADAAAKSYRKAAEAEDAFAQYELGLRYESKKKYEDAIYWYTKAAEQGNEIAQFAIGKCYECGRGVEKDYFIAAQWYMKSAEQGDGAAKTLLERLTNKLDAASL